MCVFIYVHTYIHMHMYAHIWIYIYTKIWFFFLKVFLENKPDTGMELSLHFFQICRFYIAWNSLSKPSLISSACLCLAGASIKGACHHNQRHCISYKLFNSCIQSDGWLFGCGFSCTSDPHLFSLGLMTIFLSSAAGHMGTNTDAAQASSQTMPDNSTRRGPTGTNASD